MKYFAYGSNMDETQMKERCPDSVLLDKAVLDDYKIAFTIFSPKRQCGCADIIQAKGERVWGLLYEVSVSDLEKLDKFEGHPEKYKRLQVNVTDDSGTTHLVETYQVFKKEAEFIKPSKHYLGIMQEAARKFNFPTEYKSLLSDISTID